VISVADAAPMRTSWAISVAGFRQSSVIGASLAKL
jgi:hypothetical protein